jgi:predicted lipoprotein with Yx(FWY)xxD motif
MDASPRTRRRGALSRTTVLGLTAAASLGIAACGSSGYGTAGTGSSSSSSQSPAAGGAADPAITVAAASVPGVGTVLVNGSGRTLYLLTSEKSGTLTCTDDNGCTKVWPDTELPSGTLKPIAGTGIQESMLSTVKGPSGALYITYAGWPLYTFSGDPGPGQARGQGIVSFGGTWQTLTPAGTPVTTTSTTSTTSSSGGSGY